MKNGAPLLLLLLASCGFQAVYGSHADNGEVASTLNDVAIDNIPDRNGQMLRNDLIDRMYGKGRPETPLYHLSVTLNMSVADLGIQADATSTRSLLDMTGHYILKDMQDKVLLDGTAHSITSFNKLLNQYGSLAADESAQERTVNEVSEQIINRLNLYFAEHGEQAKEQAKTDAAAAEMSKRENALKPQPELPPP